MDLVRAAVSYTAVSRRIAFVEAVAVAPAVVAVVNLPGVVASRMVCHIAVVGAVSARSRENAVVCGKAEGFLIIIFAAVTAGIGPCAVLILCAACSDSTRRSLVSACVAGIEVAVIAFGASVRAGV
jgi:hypothetical protein